MERDAFEATKQAMQAEYRKAEEEMERLQAEVERLEDVEGELVELRAKYEDASESGAQAPSVSKWADVNDVFALRVCICAHMHLCIYCGEQKRGGGKGSRTLGRAADVQSPRPSWR